MRFTQREHSRCLLDDDESCHCRHHCAAAGTYWIRKRNALYTPSTLYIPSVQQNPTNQGEDESLHISSIRHRVSTTRCNIALPLAQRKSDPTWHKRSGEACVCVCAKRERSVALPSAALHRTCWVYLHMKRRWELENLTFLWVHFGFLGDVGGRS